MTRNKGALEIQWSIDKGMEQGYGCGNECEKINLKNTSEARSPECHDRAGRQGGTSQEYLKVLA